MSKFVTWYVLRSIEYDADSEDLYESALGVWEGGFHTTLHQAKLAAQDEVSDCHLAWAGPDDPVPQLAWSEGPIVDQPPFEWAADCEEQERIFRITKLRLPYRLPEEE